MPVYVHVNIVGEWSGVNEEMAQAYLEHFDNINCLLAKHNLPAHLEPDYALDWDDEDANRQYMSNFPCECLLYLRRAFVLNRHNQENNPEAVQPVVPVMGEGLAPWLPWIQAEAVKQESHLLFHKDDDGAYIPLAELEKPLLSTDPQFPVLGSILGSSYKLLDELVEVAPALGIELEDDTSLSPAVAQQLFDISSDESHPYSNEICAWLALHQCCEMSIKNKTAIVFRSTG